MQDAQARGFANGVQDVVELGLNEAATEMHVGVSVALVPPVAAASAATVASTSSSSFSSFSSFSSSTPSVTLGFRVTCVSATPRVRADQSSVARLLATLRPAATRVLYVPDGPTAGFKVRVDGWRSFVSSSDPRRYVEEVRTRVQALALVHAGVAWTVYDQAARRFVFKSLRRDGPLEKVVRFFGGVDPELVVSLDATCDGWRVSGHAVLPPVGHPSRSRQRVYVHGALVTDLVGVAGIAGIADRIEAMYGEAYAGASRQLGGVSDGAGRLERGTQPQVVRKGLNAHPMFVLEIEMANADARRLAGGARGADVRDVSGASAAVERAFLCAWSKTLTGRLLKILERDSRQEQEQASASGRANEHRIVRVGAGWGGLGLGLGLGRGRGRGRGCGREDGGGRTVGTDSGHVFGASITPTLFDDMALDADVAELHADRQALRHIPKKRRSLAGVEAIAAILNGTLNQNGNPKATGTTATTATAVLDVLMPHTATHSTFSNPVITSAALQPTQAPVTRRDLLNAPRLLGQIDRKFIAFVTPDGTLAIVDQHAADERVRLERLTRDLLVIDEVSFPSSLTTLKPNPARVWAHQLDSSIALRVGDDEEVLFQRYAQASVDWGWRWTWDKPSSSASAAAGASSASAAASAAVTARVLVTHVPCLFGARVLSAADLKLYVYQLASCGGGGGGGGAGGGSGGDTYHAGGRRPALVVPDAVHRTLASLACRGAIMFGDHVTDTMASKLISSLASTKQYYECAHGRPTVVALWSAAARPSPTRLEKNRRTFVADLYRKLKSETI